MFGVVYISPLGISCALTKDHAGRKCSQSAVDLRAHISLVVRVNEPCVLVFVCMRLTPWMSHTRVVNRKTKPCVRSLLYNGIRIYDNARHARDYRNFNSSPICHIKTRLRRLEFYPWYHGFYCKKPIVLISRVTGVYVIGASRYTCLAAVAAVCKLRAPSERNKFIRNIELGQSLNLPTIAVLWR